MTDLTQQPDTRSSAETAASGTADGAAVRIWLYLVAVLILGMVLLGGATRLTDSGLSITEWKPIHGVIPPLNAAEWQEEFAKYQQIPEYQLINKGMSLDAFKTIFWWEWAHRLMGRVIGFAVLLPMVFFIASGRISRWLMPRLIALFVLGGLQGAVGWWMVASGLTERTDVSQYRLAVHLTLACLLFAYTIWLARRTGRHRRSEPAGALRFQATLIVWLVVLQIALGGLVAGLDAGLAFNTWPLIDGTVIPGGLFVLDPWWLNVFETVKTVQFDHRMMAYLLIAVVLWHLVRTLQQPADGAIIGRALLVAAVCAVQIALGILTLLQMVPMGLALAHQGTAVVLLGAAVAHREALMPRRGQPTP